jgi:hypothetical protein
MSPLLIVVAAGLVVLLGLAAVVGAVEGRAQRSAWTRIAARRRALAALEESLAAQRAELLDREIALVEEVERLRRLGG